MVISNFVFVQTAGIELMIFVIEQFDLKFTFFHGFILKDVHSHQYVIFGLRKFLPLIGLSLFSTVAETVAEVHCNKIIN